MALFAVTTFVIFHFGLDRDRLEGELAAGVLWVTLLFAAILGINRLFVAEREQGGLRRHPDGADRAHLAAGREGGRAARLPGGAGADRAAGVRPLLHRLGVLGGAAAAGRW